MDTIVNKKKIYKEWKNQTYLDEFLSLRCAGDIINVLNPIQNFQKEVSEAMAVIKQLKKIVFSKNTKYALWDFCSGNALVPAISAFLLPIEHSYAIDKKERKRPWDNIRKFTYVKTDIYYLTPPNPSIILTAVHACGDNAKVIIDTFNRSKSKHLILMPCCSGHMLNRVPQLISDKLDPYEKWCYYLYGLIDTPKKNIFVDNKILSPKNIIIVANK